MNKTVIEHLNIALANELIAINQYILHYKILEDWGYSKLAKHSKAESIDEMKHAEALIERILTLNGIPKMEYTKKLKIGQNVKEILENDLKLEEEGMKDYAQAVAYCHEVKDFVSAKLFEDLLVSEQHHVDYLTTQLSLYNSLGEQNYLNTQV